MLMQMLSVSALITSYETVGDHTEFITQVSCNGEVWLVSRRFSDFDQLHSRLVSRFGDLIEARLPEKQWFGRFDPNFLAKRQVNLQAYLESLLLTPGILDDRSLQHFLDLEKRVDWPGELSGAGAGSNGRPSGSFPSKSVTLNENDRLSAIVDRAGLAFIDISEAPEPLEAEQAVQRKNEIVAAAHALLPEQALAAHFAAQLSVLRLPAGGAALGANELLARLDHGAAAPAADRALLLAALARADDALALRLAPPSSPLLAVMELSLAPANNSAGRGSLSGDASALLDGGDAGLATSLH